MNTYQLTISSKLLKCSRTIINFMKKDKKKHISLKIQEDAQKTASSYAISGAHHAFFPFKPYPQQEQLVAAIQQTILKRKYALIESPTGTGKTICLLVGALSAFVDDPQESKAKIYYLTRTHSQISQIIAQLKKTPYKCNVNIIGSRQHMCVNASANRQGTSIERACMQLCNQKLCAYKNFQNVNIIQPLDLQELKEMGKKQCFCPYYYSKQATDKCQLTILPFNYILDQSLFDRNHLNLKDSVLIFDEAHNVDNISEEGSSIQITENFVKQGLNELKGLLRIMKPKNRKSQRQSFQNAQVQSVKYMLENFILKLSSSTKTVFSVKGQIVRKMQELTSYFDPTDNIVIPGIDLGNYSKKLQQWKSITKHFYKREMLVDSYEKLLACINRIFEVLSSNNGVEEYLISIGKTQNAFEGNSFNFQCLSASFAFQKISAMKPRSIILCSGTMGNLKSWQKNLNLPFDFQINLQSFITKKQLKAQIWKKQNKTTFDFSYRNKNEENQYRQLIKKLKQLQRVIEGGLVVAFSNYEMMDKIMSFSPNFKKPLFSERKKSDIDQIFEKYSKQANKQGAILFIIAKGRFSEGINFSGQLCRCLVFVGIPFLPIYDNKVEMKKKYLEKKVNKQTAEKWYITQAMRPILQTMGRVIRNKKDYGVIILVDNRFENKQEIYQQLPKWFKKCLTQNFIKNSVEEIEDFFHEKPWQKNQLYQENQVQVVVSTKKSSKFEKIGNEIEKKPQVSTLTKSTIQTQKIGNRKFMNNQHQDHKNELRSLSCDLKRKPYVKNKQIQLRLEKEDQRELRVQKKQIRGDEIVQRKQVQAAKKAQIRQQEEIEKDKITEKKIVKHQSTQSNIYLPNNQNKQAFEKYKTYSQFTEVQTQKEVSSQAKRINIFAKPFVKKQKNKLDIFFKKKAFNQFQLSND